MANDTDECFSSILAALNQALQLWDVDEIAADGALAEALRLHIKGRSADDYLRRPTTTVRASLAADLRERTVRNRFPENRLATTKRGQHVHLVGFDEQGFAVVEGFLWNPRDNTVAFNGAVHKLPVQTSLGSCLIHTEAPSLRPDELYFDLSRIAATRAEQFRNKLNIKP